MKESFGFIERADVVKEIFFHFSEAEGNVELRPGDDVEFTIQTRSVSPNFCIWLIIIVIEKTGFCLNYFRDVNLHAI